MGRACQIERMQSVLCKAYIFFTHNNKSRKKDYNQHEHNSDGGLPSLKPHPSHLVMSLTSDLQPLFSSC